MSDWDSFGGGSNVLLTAMERVHIAIVDRRGADVIVVLLDDLARLCSEHFATGERVLRRYGYINLEARLEIPGRLLERIPGLQARIRAGQDENGGIVDLLRSLWEQAGYEERFAA